MGKKMLAFLSALTLVVGMIVAPISAATTTGAYENYEVGYSKKDINPWINYTVGDKTLGIAAGTYSDAAEHIVTTTIHKHDGTKFTGETEEVQIVAMSMGGHGDSLNRTATCFTDDNGDGYLGYGDGIFITCTSVTDDSGNTVMYFTVDTTGSDLTMTNEVCEKVVVALGRENISENQIMFTANHSHAGPAFGNHRKAAEGTAWRAYYDYVIDQMVEAAKEAFNNKSAATMSKGEINVSSSLRSIDNSNPNNADASYSYRLNNIRHYNVTSDMYKAHVHKDSNGNIVESGWKSCNLYPECKTHLVGSGLTTIFSSHGGKPFREQVYNHMDADGNLLGTTTGYTSLADYDLKRNAIEYVDIYKNQENQVFEGSVAEADETLYVLQFERENAEPVVLINWRAHSTMNATGNWRNLSSDFANSLRYRLENNKTLFGGDTNYCVGFWQGAGGNIVTTGQVESAYNWNDPDFMPETGAAVKTPYATVTKDEQGKVTAVEYPADSFYDAYYKAFTGTLYDNDFYYTNKYGYLLGEVTLDCLDSEMITCAVGSIATKQVSMELERQQFSEGLLATAAHWQTLGGSTNTKLTFPFRYTWTDGNVYILNSSKHATEVAGRIGKTNTMMDLELNVITIGTDVAMVTIPNEPFDHYSDEYIAAYDVYNADGKITDAEWEELVNIAQTDNDWYDLAELSYGMPFVLGYTNSANGYLPDAWAYDYNTHYEGDPYYGVYGPGCYESNVADMERGSGEAVIAKLKEMLETINDGKKTAYCKACDEIAVWEPLSADQLQVRLTDGHHYLTENVAKHKEDTFRFDIGSAQSGSDAERALPVTVCLDLNGKTLGVNTNAFRVKLKSTLNIMDSVGGGEIVSVSGITGEVNAGMIYLRGTSTLNLYGGTLRAVRAENADPAYGVTTGAVVSGSGSFNMYGGTIIGGELIAPANETGGGAAIRLNASGYNAVNLYGGAIQSGTAATGYPGDCVNFTGSVPVKLSGNVTVADIYFEDDDPKLTVSGFTGSAHLTYADDITIENGANIGTMSGTVSLADDTITCDGYKVVGDVGSLWLFDSSVKASLNGTPYTNVNDAVTDYNDGDVIKLVNSTDETVSIPVGKSVYVDMNGCNIEAVKAGGTVYCIDTQTDDYKVDAVNHTGYGKIKAYTGNVLGAPIGDYVNANYLKVEDAINGTSFHRVVMDITDMTLRPKDEGAQTYDPSLYYKCDFLGDEIVAENIESFGVALSLAGEPDKVGLDKCGYSVLENFQPGVSGNAGRSTLLVGIMKESNVYLINKRNAELTVYGQAYVQLKNGGTYLYGEAKNRSFKQQIEKMDTDAVWTGLDVTAKDDAATLYSIYEKVMRTWTIPNIAEHANSDENER